ncbi:Casein kinase I isoform delta-like protein [Hordeum vulgare]|nr:Casein kinase I isoform delta-like protein [Hordeum vulgare]
MKLGFDLAVGIELADGKAFDCLNVHGEDVGQCVPTFLISYAQLIIIDEVQGCSSRGSAFRGLEELFDPFCIWGNDMSMNISQVKKLRMIVRIKKPTVNNNKIYVCTMKKTSVNNRMSFTKQFTNDYLSNHLHGQETKKVSIQHQLYNIEVFLKRTKVGWAINHSHWPKVPSTFNITEGSIFTFTFNSFPDEVHLCIY